MCTTQRTEPTKFVSRSQASAMAALLSLVTVWILMLSEPITALFLVISITIERSCSADLLAAPVFSLQMGIDLSFHSSSTTCQVTPRIGAPRAALQLSRVTQQVIADDVALLSKPQIALFVGKRNASKACLLENCMRPLKTSTNPCVTGEAIALIADSVCHFL